MLNKTTAEILQQGLALIHYDGERQAQAGNVTKREVFKSHYGSQPEVVRQIWHDLQSTTIPAARVEATNEKVIEFYFQAHHFLTVYPREQQRTALFGTSIRTCRDRIWEFVDKLAYLKQAKITWPEEWAENCPRFPITVDASHFVTYEIQSDPNAPQDRRRYSHKTNGPAVSYEAALAIHESRIVSINGPFPAGTNDLTIFRNRLEALIPMGSKAIADKAYRGSIKATTSSSTDPADLRRFKSRARSRQESLWRRLKRFQCLSDQFRHPIEKHQICFEAVCVVVQYQFEHGSPLFPV
jgi:DDE superfamily endonuclease